MRSAPAELQGEEPAYAVECEVCEWRRFAVSEYTAYKICGVHVRSERYCGEQPEVIELADEE